jgi:proline dehydrogenase
MLRAPILAAARSHRLQQLVTHAPVTRTLVHRFAAGEEVDDAIAASRALIHTGLRVSLDRLGEDCTDEAQAKATTAAYLTLLDRLGAAGLTEGAEVSVKLSAVGQLLDRALAVDNAGAVCAAAGRVGTTVTLDMEDHTTTDSTLGILQELRRDFPSVGAVLQAYLRRTEADCRDLSYAGSRVRLCKGAYNEPESVAYQKRIEVDRSYVRCLNVLLAGRGYPMLATHDPRIIAIVDERTKWYERVKGSYEYQMLYGVRPAEQKRLAGMGEVVRIYVPYGTEWYGYLMRRMAERPANLAVFLRSLTTKK